MIYFNKTIGSILVVILIFITSCESIVNNGQDRLIARAENHYLYLSDIKDSLKLFKSVDDSISKVRGLINNWAKKETYL